MVAIDFEKLFSQLNPIESNLIPLLQKVQQEEGYLSPESIRAISRFLHVSENRIYGVATFYSQFRFNPPGRHTIKICLGTACHVQGGEVLREALVRELFLTPGGITPDRRFDLQQVACLGCCALAPVMLVDEDIHGKVTPGQLMDILSRYE